MQSGYPNDPANAAKESEQIKSHFITREGTYKLMTLSEYSRPNRVPLNPQGGNNVGSAPVRVSFLSVPPSKASTSGENDPNEGNGSPAQMDPFFCPDRICFNVGRELYVYMYRGVKNAADLSKPIDKRVYKGTYPTCHDFNQQMATADSCNLIIGFSAGQIQLIDPFRKDYQLSRLYNEDRLIDKSRVSCLKWVPGNSKHFLAAHASGFMYVYNEELACSPGAPSYQLFKQSDGFAVYTCKTKSTRNPMYRWNIGEGAINEFAFSGPDAKLLATVSQDGFLRIFNYHTMELVGLMRSYFGGLLCLAWSPDTKYIVTGGEDDLVTVYAVQEKRVVCRGQGHKSWISQVAFDPYTTWLGDTAGVPVDLGSEEDLRPASLSSAGAGPFKSTLSSSIRGSGGVLRRNKKESVSSMSLVGASCYRIGSVGHDTQLCLWDISDDLLRQSSGRQRTSSLLLVPPQPVNCFMESPGASAAKADKKAHKRHFSLGGKKQQQQNSEQKEKERERKDETARLLGTAVCPRIDEVSLIEPLVCKKIAHERLTVLEFREDCIVTACQEGFICTWARPGKAGLSHQQSINSPNPGGSPNLLPGGTIV